MRLLPSLPSWRALGMSLALALSSQLAAAQLLASTRGQAYDFLTVTAIESPTRNMAKLLFTPAFNGHTELQLDAVGAFSSATILDQLRHNEEVVTQSLGDLSAAGWELIQVATTPLAADKNVSTTRYLLRKAKS
ncbi:hypothetical protein [Hymenobacter cheonanensis]|uniref:hypothetical protein n=1 Tax=Hymenobacter sp. CA2-7 TaxID=3063993 RepID=UPI0027135294|nr:hypothetical protein [Hymenobacter sp. CA2-7]MDO7884813.1 hypothetical protein [Hymenobacter sp. CA2-7]